MKGLVVRLAAPLQRDSIVDGEGLRMVIWFQGCPHHCKGCHNPKSHEMNEGTEVKLSEIKEAIENLKHHDGITFSGGEPMAQPEALLTIINFAKENKLNIWCYSGYTFEQILEMSKTNSIYLHILKLIDVLVDGPFIFEEKSMNIKFRGSKNQRIIDSKKSLKANKPVLIQKYRKEKKVKVSLY